MDYRHFKVVHKLSNKIISIYQLRHDITWIGKERDEFIAIPAEVPEGVEEIKMVYTKGFKRYEGTNKEQIINPFFKRKSGEEKTLSELSTGGESKAHRIAKNEIYERLYNGDLKLNGKTIQELGAKDLGIRKEFHSDTGHAIADVYIEFDSYPNHHPTYKKGIDIEIQFSNQNESKTSQRTLQRLREGWSVVWLWKEDFDNNDRFIHDNIIVQPQEESIKIYLDEENNKLLESLNNLGEKIDDKVSNAIIKINEGIKEEKEIIYSTYDNRIDQINDAIEEEKVLIQQIKNLNKSLDEKFLLNEKEIEQKADDAVTIIEKRINTIINNQDLGVWEKIFLERIERDERFINKIGDIFFKLKIKELMEKLELNSMLYVREFFMEKFDKMLKEIYEDKYGDIEKSLQRINSKEKLLNPQNRQLIPTNLKNLGDTYGKKNS